VCGSVERRAAGIVGQRVDLPLDRFGFGRLGVVDLDQFVPVRVDDNRRVFQGRSGICATTAVCCRRGLCHSGWFQPTGAVVDAGERLRTYLVLFVPCS